MVGKISFGGIPISSSNWFSQLFRPKFAGTHSRNRTGTYLKPRWTWPHQNPSGTFSRTFSGTSLNLARLSTTPSGTFSRTFSGNSLNLARLCTKASQTFSGTFSGTLLSLTWLCTTPKPCWTWRGSAPDLLLRNPVETDVALHQSLPDLLRNLLRSGTFSPKPCWAWPGSAPNSPRPSPDLLWNPVEHQSLPNFLRNLLRNPCWTWRGSAPRPPRPSLEPSPEPSPESCWTWCGSAPKSPETLLNLTWLCTKLSQTFSGTFSGILLSLTWLCTKASQTLSGTFSGTPLNLTRLLHQCTPELFWAEDPISLRCWGISFDPSHLGSKSSYIPVNL